MLIGALWWAGASRLDRAGTGVGKGAAGGGGGARPAVNFFVLPRGGSPPAAVDLPTPSIPAASLPALSQIKVDLPRLDFGSDSGTGGASGPGARPGSGFGSTEGSGTGGEGDYIVIASPRTMIVPPKAPGSVAGHTYRVRFWVGADGRVTRVEIDPPIADAAYRREFLERMLAYQFVPAQTRDMRNVASVVTVTLRIGQ